MRLIVVPVGGGRELEVRRRRVELVRKHYADAVVLHLVEGARRVALVRIVAKIRVGEAEYVSFDFSSE